MNREDMQARLETTDRWDVIVVGGGATGLGVAVDAAARGYDTLLAEQHDFAKATSSRSTKLVHGGVRYLRQGRVPLVFEALRERGRLRRNAPHLVENRSFVVPGYRWWEKPYYGLGLKVYDLLAAGHGFGHSRLLSQAETLRTLPGVAPEGLRGGVAYRDGQFDDARVAVALARTATREGATVLNRLRVTDLFHERSSNATSDFHFFCNNGQPGRRVAGVVARDTERNAKYRLSARVVVNATGIFADAVRRMDEPEASPMLRLSRGAHLVLPRSFLPGESALLVPRTRDGRVLFAIPWLGRTVVGTTDVPASGPTPEPRATPAELRYLLEHAGRYLSKKPCPEDVLSTYAGLRPLVAERSAGVDTSALSRSHAVRVSPGGLITIAGGKWTTYRQMAEDAVDRAAAVAELPERPSPTKDLRLHGWDDQAEGPLRRYGADAPALQRLMNERPELDETLQPDLPYRKADVVWAARHEMARTVEDVLARRTRALLLDAKAAVKAAPEAARLLAEELGRSDGWAAAQVRAFEEGTDGYRMPTLTAA